MREPISTPQTAGEAAPHGRPKPGFRRSLGIVLGILAILAFMAVFGWKLYDSAQGQIKSGLAPDFTLTLFDGSPLTLSQLRGQVVVINFWASWCVPCRDEAPVLEQTWRRYRDRGVLFIGVDYLDTDKEALAFIEEFTITYPNGPDLGTRIAKDYRIAGVPETFFIAKDGRVADLQIGPLTEDRLVNIIELLLQEQLPQTKDERTLR
ncbi:MAG: TlpA family protein disulfide reductase [Anaerolineae bacterium]|nr:TlpA family protein disulfide reductase [Anaerolineae bacterium]